MNNKQSHTPRIYLDRKMAEQKVRRGRWANHNQTAVSSQRGISLNHSQTAVRLPEAGQPLVFPSDEATVSARQRQDPLRKQYKTQPEPARITDSAKTSSNFSSNPFRGWVQPGSQDYGIAWPFGIHDAVGGYHDLPNPGDILCAAVATCLDSTIRIIANRFGVVLTKLEVSVSAEVDVRGTLMVDHQVPVGFQQMRCHVNIQADERTKPEQLQQLVAAAEHCCVNLQTLRSGVPVETSLQIVE